MRKSQLKSFPLPLLYHFFQFMAKNEKMIQKKNIKKEYKKNVYFILFITILLNKIKVKNSNQLSKILG